MINNIKPIPHNEIIATFFAILIKSDNWSFEIKLNFHVQLLVRIWAQYQIIIICKITIFIISVCYQTNWVDVASRNEISNIKLNADVLVILFAVKKTLPREKVNSLQSHWLVVDQQKSLPRLISHNNAKNAIVDCTLHKILLSLAL